MGNWKPTKNSRLSPRIPTARPRSRLSESTAPLQRGQGYEQRLVQTKPTIFLICLRNSPPFVAKQRSSFHALTLSCGPASTSLIKSLDPQGSEIPVRRLAVNSSDFRHFAETNFVGSTTA